MSYVIFEGGDFAGKSSTMDIVAEILRQRLPDKEVVKTCQPGSTSLGAKLRELVKTPDIEIDPIARQCIYAADAINFVNTMLNPALSTGKVVLSDRSSFVSGRIYSDVDGIGKKEFNKIWSIINPPKACRMYVFYCPDEVLKERMGSRDFADHYDNKPFEFMRTIHSKYRQLVNEAHSTAGALHKRRASTIVDSVVDADNIFGIDSSKSRDSIVDFIVSDLEKAI